MGPIGEGTGRFEDVPEGATVRLNHKEQVVVGGRIWVKDSDSFVIVGEEPEQEEKLF